MEQLSLATGQARWTQETTLSGQTYVLTFSWHGRASCWTLSISLPDGTRLLAGRAMRLGALLLRGLPRDSGLPPGDILLVDTSGTHTEATLTSLGVAHQLLYLTPADLAAEGL